MEFRITSATIAIAAASLTISSGCSKVDGTKPVSRSAATPQAVAIEAALPGHWVGSFTMVEARGVRAGAGQFQLRLGLDGPNFFRARRGCYTQEGMLHFRNGVWEVHHRGPVRADEQCLNQMVGAARGAPEDLFQHRAITLSPPGERWIAEGGARWTYLQNPPSPPGASRWREPPRPTLPPPDDPYSKAGLPGGGLNGTNLEAAEALYRHQIGASARQQDLALVCLGAGRRPGELGDPPASLLARFRGHKPPVRGHSSCRSTEIRWADRVTGAPAIVHYITALSCPSPTQCTARGGYLAGNLSASGNRYELVRTNGRWQVTIDDIEWMS